MDLDKEEIEKTRENNGLKDLEKENEKLKSYLVQRKLVKDYMNWSKENGN